MYYEYLILSNRWDEFNIIANHQLMEPFFFDIWRKNVVKIGLILQDLFLHSSVKNQFQKLIDPSLEREFYGRSNDICLISFWNDWKKHLNTLSTCFDGSRYNTFWRIFFFDDFMQSIYVMIMYLHLRIHNSISTWAFSMRFFLITS